MPELNELRKKIDDIDSRLVELIGERGRLIDQVVEYKSMRGLPALDSKRREEMLAARRKWAIKANLDPQFIQKLFREIHDYFLKQEKQVLA